ncbi:MAG TPA: hypothetical protein VE291_13470, partial [Terracidiphilus sp.]|nr:hypothetical protein [Terracidiphilus sp.]
MHTAQKLLRLASLQLLMVCLGMCPGLFAATQPERATADPALIISTSEIALGCGDTAAGPRLLWLRGSGLDLSNNDSESLPASVTIGGVELAVHWEHRAALDTHSAHHLVLVYESAHPHLQLRWEWEARAEFGPIEHRIAIRNLDKDEVWLPMVDSLAV